MAQIDLAELPAMPERDMLPARGRLYFFYAYHCGRDPFVVGDSKANAGAAPVIYSDAAVTSLVRRPFPADMDKRQELPAEPLRMSVFNTTVDPDHPVWRKMPVSAEEWDSITDAWESVASKYAYPRFQMLGHPAPVQSNVSAEVEWNHKRPTDTQDEIDQRAGQWELLFQDLYPFGDCSLYYIIRRDDLIHRRWDKAWFWLQAT